VAYLVEYFREGRKIGTTPQVGSLQKAKQFSKDGLICYQADFVRIVDQDNGGVEVWWERHDRMTRNGRKVHSPASSLGS
jgi:hypothetical protein